MSSPISYSLGSDRVQALVQNNILLHAMSTLSSLEFTIYLNQIASQMPGLEQGIHRRSLVDLQNQILSIWFELEAASLLLDFDRDLEILTLQSLALKSDQGLQCFLRDLHILSVSNDGWRRLCQWRSAMSISSTHLPVSDPSHLSSSIKFKQIDSLRIFSVAKELSHIWRCEMQAVYLTFHDSDFTWHYILAYYHMSLQVAHLSSKLITRSLQAMQLIFPQVFEIKFDLLVERVSNQAEWTSLELQNIVQALAASYYRRGTNEFLITIIKIQDDPFGYTSYLVRSRQLIILSCAVTQKRADILRIENRQVSWSDILSSLPNLRRILRLKIEVFSEEFKEEVWSPAEQRLYQTAPRGIIPLSTRYLRDFNEIFSQQDLQELNAQIYGEADPESLQWVIQLLSEKGWPKIEDLIGIDPGRPLGLTPDRLRRLIQGQEELIRNPPWGHISRRMMEDLLKTYLLAAAWDQSDYLSDPDLLIGRLLGPAPLASSHQ